MEKRITTFRVAGALVSAVLTAVFGQAIITLFSSPAWKLPGPLLAKFTNLWRFIAVFRGQAHEIQRRLHQQHGDVVCLGPTCISISNPDLMRSIYSNRAFIKSDFYSVGDVRIGNEIYATGFSTRDEVQHSSFTRPVNRFFSGTAQVLRYEDRMDETITHFLGRLQILFARPELPCPVHKWIQFLSWDLMGRATNSTEFGFLRTGDDIENLISDQGIASDYFSLIGQMPFLDAVLDKNPVIRIGPPTYTGGSMFAAKQVEKRLSGEDEHDSLKSHDFLDDYLETKKLNDAVTNTDIVDWVRRNIQGGCDPAAIAIRTIVYYCCKDLSIQERLHQEMLDAELSTAPPPYNELSQLPYLDAVVQEALRFHPPVGMPLERVVPPTGYVLPDGTVLPGGFIVGISPSVVTRHRPTFGDDADEFRPERWLPAKGESEACSQHRIARMKDGAGFVFGFGKRSCPGKNLAVVEITKVAAALFQAFEVRLVDPSKEWKIRNAWLTRQWDMDVVLTPRAK